MSCRFVPLKRWIGEKTPNYRQKRSAFRAGYHATLDDLDRELAAIKANEITIEIDLDPKDIRNDGWPRSSARPASSAVIVSFHSKHGRCSMPCDRFDAWEDNLRAIAKTLHALRDADRYGVTKSGEQYRGWTQLPPPTAKESYPTDAECGLARLADLTVEQVRSNPRSAYLRAAKLHHPDHGGTYKNFLDVRRFATELGVQ
jgi:hypothetical protein